MHLGHGDFFARAIAAIELPGSMHGQQSADLNTLRDLAELNLHAFTIRKLDAETFAFGDVVLGDLHATLGKPEPPHAVRQSRWTEPDLCHFESIADAEKHVFVGDFEAIEIEFAMAAVLLRAHYRDAADDAPTRLVAMGEKRGQAVASILRRSCNHDKMRGLGSTGNEPFAAGNDPFAVFLLGAGADHTGVRAA